MENANVNTFSPTHSVEDLFSPIPPPGRGSSIVVIGAGSFGGWSALYLLRRGFKVTVIDAWGAGNSRSSSGDETRVIRSTYGANETYFRLNVRALELWRENEIKFPKQVFHNTGVLWLCHEQVNPIVDDSIPFSKKYGMEYRRLERRELEKEFPQINCSDLSHAFLDPFGGYLKARESCQFVLDQFLKEGGRYVPAEAIPGKILNGQMKEVSLSNREKLRADAFLFACGSWLPFLFPEILSPHINCTRQEVYYFGVPASAAEVFDNMPVWVDLDGKDFYYGITGNASRGFKVGVDRRGESFHPTAGERWPDGKVLSHAREFLSHRFPSLSDAPLLENRVCPYENSATGNFIFEHHPGAKNVFFLGGGSGHGFKHGPALGELVADCLAGERMVPDLFRISF
jgi:glycine/D-amino acid oxidase-like deaminating enzyme